MLAVMRSWRPRAILRVLRRRRGMTQKALARLLGMSQQTLSRFETVGFGNVTIDVLDAWTTALGGELRMEILVAGDAPLRDRLHAGVQAWLVGLLRAAGWEVRAEVSFNHYGDRGRIDVLAYHPQSGVLLIVEIKSRVDDVQDILGRLDVKTRLGSRVANDIGWSEPSTIVPLLAVAEGSTARRRIAEHAPLFERLALRGQSAMAWLREPSAGTPMGVLLFVSPATQQAVG